MILILLFIHILFMKDKKLFILVGVASTYAILLNSDIIGYISMINHKNKTVGDVKR